MKNNIMKEQNIQSFTEYESVTENNSLDNIITFNILYNGKKIQIPFNKYYQFNDFYSQIEEMIPRTIKLKLYEIKYKNKDINPKDERLMSQIINENDNEPCFILRKKKNFIKPISKSKTFILIKNLPSFIEISNIIRKFLQSLKDGIDFSVDYKNECCIINFNNNEINFSFIAYLTKLKFSNQILRKIKISLEYNKFENIYKNKNNFVNLNSLYSTNCKSITNIFNENTITNYSKVILKSKNRRLISEKLPSIINSNKIKKMKRNFSN